MKRMNFGLGQRGGKQRRKAKDLTMENVTKRLAQIHRKTSSS